MSHFFNNKTALITGSVSGIGLGIATALAEKGARIILHGLASDEEGQIIAEQMRDLGASETLFCNHDLRDVGAIDNLMHQAAQFGGADILVNNAGLQYTAALPDIPPTVWNDILDVNLSAAFHTMRHALPIMQQRGYGRIINIASVHGLVASVNKAPYVATKFGMVGLTKVAALENAALGNRESGGITANAICPGWTETALIEPQIQAKKEAAGGDRSAGIADLLAEKQPSKRMIDTSELGALVVWLCDPIAHNVTGTSFPMDGGWTAQ